MYVKNLPNRTSEDEKIVAVLLDTLRYQSHFEVLEGSTVINSTAAAHTTVHLAYVYHKKWRVAGIGMRCKTNYTAAENPDIEMGIVGDKDLFGILTGIFAGANLFKTGDVGIQQTRGLFGASIITDTGTFAYSIGTINGQKTWQEGFKEILAANKTATLTTGDAYPFVIIEIDRMGAN